MIFQLSSLYTVIRFPSLLFFVLIILIDMTWVEQARHAKHNVIFRGKIRMSLLKLKGESTVGHVGSYKISVWTFKIS